jgi:hypothetical protein
MDFCPRTRAGFCLTNFPPGIRSIYNEFESHIGDRCLTDDVTFVFIGARPDEEYKTFEFAPSPELADHASDSVVNIRKTFTLDELNEYRESKEIPDNNFNIIHKIWDSYQPVTDMLLDNDRTETSYRKRLEMKTC